MKKGFFFLFLVMTLLLTGVSSSNAVMLGFEPASQDVWLGDSVSVDIVVSGLGDMTSPSLSTFDIDVIYDPAILSFDSYALGSYLGDISAGEAIDISWGNIFPGDANLGELSLLSPDELNALQPDGFSLATLTFNAVGIGTSELYFETSYILGDEWGDWLDADLQSGYINVMPAANPIPEPTTLTMIGAGLAGVGLLRKRYMK